MNNIDIYTSAENIEKINEIIDGQYLGKVVIDDELEAKQKKTVEDYNRIAEKLNRDYKNPERYMSRKYGKKKKFGSDILKRLNNK